MEFPETIENMMLELLELYETESGKKFPIEGYNIDEIRYYENLYGFTFPKYYKDFLLKIGKTKPYFDSYYSPKKQYNVYKYFKENDSLEFKFFNFENYPNFLIYFTDTGECEYILEDENDPEAFYNDDSGVHIPFYTTFSERIIRRLTNYIESIKYNYWHSGNIFLSDEGFPCSVYQRYYIQMKEQGFFRTDPAPTTLFELFEILREREKNQS